MVRARADRGRYVGEPVAAVVAEDRWTAAPRSTRGRVDYEELPAVVDPYQALEPGAPLVEPEWGDNVIFRRAFRGGDADAALAAAARGPRPRSVRADRGVRRSSLAAVSPRTTRFPAPRVLGLRPSTRTSLRSSWPRPWA